MWGLHFPLRSIGHRYTSVCIPTGLGKRRRRPLATLKRRSALFFPLFLIRNGAHKNDAFHVFVCISKAGWSERLNSDGHSKNRIFLSSISRHNLFFPQLQDMGQKRPKVTATQKMCSKRAHTVLSRQSPVPWGGQKEKLVFGGRRRRRRGGPGRRGRGLIDCCHCVRGGGGGGGGGGGASAQDIWRGGGEFVLQLQQGGRV